MQRKVICYIVPKSGYPTSVKVRMNEDFEVAGDGKYHAAEAPEILRTTKARGLIERRIALYRKGHPKAIPILNGLEHPHGLTTQDYLNVSGPFLPNLLRRALADNDSTKIIALLTLGLQGLSMIGIGYCAYILYQISKIL